MEILAPLIERLFSMYNIVLNASRFLNDLSGPTENQEVCPTCGLSEMFCPGHMGHISLPMPVYNPVLFGTLVKVCFCEQFLSIFCLLSLFDRF